MSPEQLQQMAVIVRAGFLLAVLLAVMAYVFEKEDDDE